MIEKKNDGGPAYPVDRTKYDDFNRPYHEKTWGLSYRDVVAIAALQGDWAAQCGDLQYAQNCVAGNPDAFIAQAELYYRMADAMIKVRRADGRKL